MKLAIKLKINRNQEVIIKPEDLVSFNVDYNNQSPVDNFRLEIGNVEKYLTIFEHKIDFFKAYILYNNITHELEIFYPSKKEIKGSRIVLTCTSIKLSHLKKPIMLFLKNNTLDLFY